MTRVALRKYGPEFMFLLAAGWASVGVLLLDHPRVWFGTGVFQIFVGMVGALMAVYTRYDVGYGTEVRDA